MEPIKLIPLHQGRAEVWANGAENESVHLTYDVSNYLKAWPDAQPSVAFERADGEKYPHAWELDGPVLHIPLLLSDTEISGMCKCMITMLSGDGRANTVVFYGSVTQGIDSLGEEPADLMLGIIEQVNLAAADAHTAKVGAEDAQSNAEDAMDGAVSAAVSAKNSENAAKLSEENALQASKDATAAQNAASASAQAAANSEANALVSEGAASGYAVLAGQRANAAQQASEAAREEAETAARHAAAADASADEAQRHAAAAQESLENMEERYYVPSIDDDGYLHFTPTSDEMEAVEPVYVRGPVGPAGEGGAGDIFTLHYGSDGKMDKTFAQLRSAVNSKKTPILIDDTDGETMYYLNSVAMSGNTTMSYTFASIRYQTATSRILTGKRITYYATGNVTKGDVEIAARNPERLVIIRGEETKEYYGNSPVSFEIPEKLPTVGKLLLRGAVNADFDGSSDVTVEIPEGGGSGLPDHTAADAGKILYIAPDGNAAWLKVGNGLKIENGTLMLNLTTGDSVSFSENADGSVSLAGVVFTEQDDGSVLLENATFTAQADGSVLIQ